MVRDIYGEKIVKVKMGNEYICDVCGRVLNPPQCADIIRYYKIAEYDGGFDVTHRDICSDECVKKYINDYLSKGMPENFGKEIRIRSCSTFCNAYEEGEESYEEKDIT